LFVFGAVLQTTKDVISKQSTYLCGKLLFCLMLWIALGQTQVFSQEVDAMQNGAAKELQTPEVARGFPRFRNTDPDQSVVPPMVNRAVTLLTDQDFAPWSFMGSDGRIQGISVDIALKACTDLGFACSLKPMPFDNLRNALSNGDGDVIISGLRADAALLDKILPTRPYFMSLGRFVARQGTSLPSSDPRVLAGKRLGYVRNSAHGAFLQKHFARGSLTAYDKLTSMQEALRTGAIDAGFGDALALAYWLSGSAARNCCQALGKAYVDRDSFSRGLFFAVRGEQRDLRDAFDVALDTLEENGDTARIFTGYLPAALW
jgi:polar amino acid transport system substrate-binding protein